MPYFGRKPKKPGSVPGAASGGQPRKDQVEARGRVQRPERPGKILRAARSERSAR